MMSEKIRIVFDGPPSHESGRFIEVENERGEGISFGKWKQEGEYWYLEFSNPAVFEARIMELEAERGELRNHESFNTAEVLRVIADEIERADGGLRAPYAAMARRNWLYTLAALLEANEQKEDPND